MYQFIVDQFNVLFTSLGWATGERESEGGSECIYKISRFNKMADLLTRVKIKHVLELTTADVVRLQDHC